MAPHRGSIRVRGGVGWDDLLCFKVNLRHRVGGWVVAATAQLTDLEGVGFTSERLVVSTLWENIWGAILDFI